MTGEIENKLAFTKMHGLGNDYVVINCFKEKVKYPKELAKISCNRHFGVGADGMLLVSSSQIADCKMTMYNPDGSEGEMCGNGIRCVARFAYDKGLVTKKKMTIETKSGRKTVTIKYLKTGEMELEVSMGNPIITPREIPLSDCIKNIKDIPLIIDKNIYYITAISMGNPHGVVFVNDVHSINIETLGPLLEHAHIFPKKANIEFVHCKNRKQLEVRVWERGVGETLACGTGACASLVASILHGYTEETVTVTLPGGSLIVEWRNGEEVKLRGDANIVFEGVWKKET